MILSIRTNWYKKAYNIEEPWTLTQQEFLKYHYTGFISSTAYEKYRTVEGLNWIKKDKYPILYSTKTFGNKIIEFRKQNEILKYVKWEGDEILRDKNGMAIMMTPEEIDKAGLMKTDASIAAFDGDIAIGWVSDEFGADGVWVVEEYQRLGIGTYLLMEFRKQFKSKRKIGQMTEAGIALTKRVHKEYVIKALEDGKNVPENVLKDYPDLLQKYKK